MNNKEKDKDIDFASILAVASGSSILVGTVLGPVGALLGSVLGGGFGYWAQVNTKDSAQAKHTDKKQSTNKVHY